MRVFNDKVCAPYLTITLTSLLRHSYEGKVLYFLDGDGKVIGLVKVETKSPRHTCRSGLTRLASPVAAQKKTVWYIIIRAVREKMKAYGRLGIGPVAKNGGSAHLQARQPCTCSKRYPSAA
jgi:hypothetical protein